MPFNQPEPKLKEQWATFDTRYEAGRKYRELLQLGNLYSATIATPLESTDYEPGQYLVVWATYIT